MSKKEASTKKIKTTQPMLYEGKAVPKNTVLTVSEKEARLFISAEKAVIAGPQTKEGPPPQAEGSKGKGGK